MKISARDWEMAWAAGERHRESRDWGGCAHAGIKGRG